MFQHTDWTAMIVALISLTGVVFTALVALRTKRDTRDINRAVNHNSPGEMRLYDLAVENHLGLAQLSQRVGFVELKLDAHLQGGCGCQRSGNNCPSQLCLEKS